MHIKKDKENRSDLWSERAEREDCSGPGLLAGFFVLRNEPGEEDSGPHVLVGVGLHPPAAIGSTAQGQAEFAANSIVDQGTPP